MRKEGRLSITVMLWRPGKARWCPGNLQSQKDFKLIQIEETSRRIDKETSEKPVAGPHTIPGGVIAANHIKSTLLIAIFVAFVVLFHLWHYFSLLAWIINSCMLRIFQANNDLVKANRKSKDRFKFDMCFQGKYTNHIQYLKISFSFRLCCEKDTLRWKKIYKIYEKF